METNTVQYNIQLNLAITFNINYNHNAVIANDDDDEFMLQNKFIIQKYEKIREKLINNGMEKWMELTEDEVTCFYSCLYVMNLVMPEEIGETILKTMIDSMGGSKIIGMDVPAFRDKLMMANTFMMKDFSQRYSTMQRLTNTIKMLAEM